MYYTQTLNSSAELMCLRWIDQNNCRKTKAEPTNPNQNILGLL